MMSLDLELERAEICELLLMDQWHRNSWVYVCMTQLMLEVGSSMCLTTQILGGSSDLGRLVGRAEGVVDSGLVITGGKHPPPPTSSWKWTSWPPGIRCSMIFR